jgi:hypothetical protein
MRDGWKNNVVSAEIVALHKNIKQCPSAEAAGAMARRLNDVGGRTDYILLTRLCFQEARASGRALFSGCDRFKLMRCTNLIRNALQSYLFA